MVLTRVAEQLFEQIRSLFIVSKVRIHIGDLDNRFQFIKGIQPLLDSIQVKLRDRQVDRIHQKLDLLIQSISLIQCAQHCF